MITKMAKRIRSFLTQDNNKVVKVMLSFPFRLLALAWLILDNQAEHVESLEPITSSIAVAVASLSTALFFGYEGIKCKTTECCTDAWINPNFTALNEVLRTRLHGQHLVRPVVVKALRAHLRNPNPQKALALSFHGWTGTGKNFVSGMITNHVYHRGRDSHFVHLFAATHHFPHESHIETYKDQLRDWIRGNVSACPRSLFIFDEIDKMPHRLLDTIKPYLDYYPDINGVDYRKAMFIFLSNTVASDITQHTLNHWRRGEARESITYKEMEDVITLGSYNEKGVMAVSITSLNRNLQRLWSLFCQYWFKPPDENERSNSGGLWHSELIQKHLITAFVPFLPLERKHIKLCIIDVLEQKNITATTDLVDRVANELQYSPGRSGLFSTSGCKRIEEKVDFVVLDVDDDY